MPKKKPSGADNVPGIIRLSDVGPIEYVPSGIKEIDELLGGFPRGRLTELVGNEAVGKSTVASRCAVAMAENGKVLYVDAEQALNPDRLLQMGADPKKIDYTTTYALEDLAEQLIPSLAKYDAIIIDSIAVLQPKAMAEGNIGDANIALYARLMAKFVKQLKPALGKSKCALVCINQWRQSPDMFKPKYIPGGTAYRYALDLSIELHQTPSSDKIEKDGKRIGHWVHAKVIKSRVSAPHIETKFKLLYDLQ